jgi:hypothetical protein
MKVVFEFNAEVFIGVKGSCLGNQDLAEVSLHPPVPLFIRLGKCTPQYSVLDIDTIEFLFSEPEAGLDILEALPIGLSIQAPSMMIKPTSPSARFA